MVPQFSKFYLSSDKASQFFNPLAIRLLSNALHAFPGMVQLLPLKHLAKLAEQKLGRKEIPVSIGPMVMINLPRPLPDNLVHLKVNISLQVVCPPPSAPDLILQPTMLLLVAIELGQHHLSFPHSCID